MKVLSGEVRECESCSSTDSKMFELPKEKHMEKIMSGRRENLENVMMTSCFIAGVLGNQINLVGTSHISQRKLYVSLGYKWTESSSIVSLHVDHKHIYNIYGEI